MFLRELDEIATFLLKEQELSLPNWIALREDLYSLKNIFLEE